MSGGDIEIEIEIEEDVEVVEPRHVLTPKAAEKRSPPPASPTPTTPVPPSSPLPSPLPPASASPSPSLHATAPALSQRPPSPTLPLTSAFAAASLPEPLPSAVASSGVKAPSSPANATQTSSMSLTSASSSLSVNSGASTDLSAVHLFSTGIHLPDIITSTSNSTGAHTSPDLTSTSEGAVKLGTADLREAAALEDLVAALNKENARLLLESKRREQQLESLQLLHARDLKRLRDDLHTQLALSHVRQFDDSEEGKAKEISALRTELHTATSQAKEREQALMQEINRLTSLAAASTPFSTSTEPAPASLPPPVLSPSVDERDEYIAHLQHVLHEKDQHIRQLTDKLHWYTENQPLLTQYEARAGQLQLRIQHLEKALASHSHSSRAEAKSLPADLKRIKALEKEVELLRKSGRTVEDRAVVGLIEAARPSVEESEVVRALRVRVGEVEREMETRDETWEHRLRAIRQEQEKIRLAYEKRLKALQDSNRTPQQSRRKSMTGGLGKVGAEVVNEDVVREMESRMEEMRQFYEQRIEQLTRDREHPSTSLPSHSHASPATLSLHTPARLTGSPSPARSRRAPHRAPDRSKSPHSSQEAVTGEAKGGEGKEAVRTRSLSPPAVRRKAATPPPVIAETVSRAMGSSTRGISRADVDRELHHLQSALQAAHKEELSHLSSHYASLFASLQSQMGDQVTALQHRVDEAEDKSLMMAEQVRDLQLEVWKREKELQEKGWEVDRYREKPGVREFVVLEREVKELQERMERREREYREETEMARLREEEDRTRVEQRYEAVIRRKKEQIRQFEVEMEKLVDLLHRQQQLHTNAGRHVTQSHAPPPSPLHSPLTPARVDEPKRDGAGGAPPAAPVPNYVELLERMEAEGGAVFEQMIGGLEKEGGKENTRRSRASAKGTAGSAKRPHQEVPRTTASAKAAPVRRVGVGSVKKPLPVRSGL